jgi:hypothetical protein
MNLQRINPIPSRERGTQFRFACRECGHVKVADERTHADLDAPAFSAYVCGDCLGIERAITCPSCGDVFGSADFQRHRTYCPNTAGVEHDIAMLMRTWGPR